MKKLLFILTFIVMSSISLSYEVFVGTEAFRTHWKGKNYNSVPRMVLAGFRDGNNEVLGCIFKNSHFQDSFALSFNKYADINSKISLFSGIGFASGYGKSKTEDYDTNIRVRYAEDDALMLTDDIMLTVIAGVEYKVNEDLRIDLFSMGSCIDIVLKFKL